MVSLFGGSIGVEGRGVAAEDIAVGVDAAEVRPVVEHGKDELCLD